MSDDLATYETMQDNAEHAGDLYKADWIARFVVRFSERMNAAGFDGNDLTNISTQHAEASWGVRDQMQSSNDPEEAANGEFDALADSI